MKDINLLIEKFKINTAGGYTEEAFRTTLNDIAKFYCDNFDLDIDEVAILLTDKDNMVLSFAYPEHLVNAGMIPISSPDAFAARVLSAHDATPAGRTPTTGSAAHPCVSPLRAPVWCPRGWSRSILSSASCVMAC